MAWTTTVLLVGGGLAVASLSMFAMAQGDVRAPKPGTPVPGARPAPVVQPVGRPRITTPVHRATDASRRRLLEAARRAPAPGMRRERYLALMHAVWAQDLDANGDGELTWVDGPESLAPKVDTCVIVEYEKQAAKKEKDPKKPGVWIETPEAWVPKDWRTWGEVLASTKVQGGQCLALGVATEWKCMKPDMSGLLPEPETSSSGWNFGPKIPCTATNGGILQCPSDPDAGKRHCEARGGVYQPFTNTEGCEKWQTFGPETEPAFLQVAARNFDAEDFDHDGVIGAGEGQYLCMN